jgi:DNA-binding NtrC family response regulator
LKTLGTILLVDDEAYVRDSLAAVLRRKGFAVRTASGPDEALQAHSLDGVDAVITDLRMSGGDGLGLISQLMRRESGLAVIVLTAHGSVPSAVECMKAGAREYFQKPIDPEELVLSLRRVLNESGLRRELEYLRTSGERPVDRDALLGVSPKWKQALEMGELAAEADANVLLLGESGTGKEEIAKYIHRLSARAQGPFVCVNCAAIPVELFESEFFGHRRGSFTGAIEDRVGRFKVAHRGTLLLDEIDSLPERAQAKVLRVLQDGIFQRVGDSQSTTVDVRVLSASNSDLAAEVEAGRFRRDLYYRINVVTIGIAPLRERREDIPILARAFLQEFSARLGKRIDALHPDALAALDAYSWPGNVRELRNVIERGVLLERANVLGLGSLPAEIHSSEAGRADRGHGLRTSLLAAERRLLEEALEQSGGVRREAARALGIDERNLSYYLRKHGLRRS